MKDLNKLFNYVSPALKQIIEEITLCIDPNKTNLISMTEIANMANTQFKDVRRVLKILQLVEVLEYESMGSRGTIVKIIDRDTFQRLKDWFK